MNRQPTIPQPKTQSAEPKRMNEPVSRLLVLLALAAAALTSCAPPEAPEAPPEVARNVRVLPLAATDLQEYFEISGPLQPVRGTEVSAEEGGTVDRIVHNKGEYVDDGDVLVELDRDLLAVEVASAEAGVELAEYNADRARQLLEADKGSRIQALSAETQARQARAGLRAARLRYERAAIKTPFAGLVSNRYVEPGQLVAPGQPVARVVDPYVLKLVGALTEREVAWLREGAAASVRLDGVSRPVRGEVAWLAFEASPVTGKFPVEVHVDNANRALRPGVVGRATIHKRTHAGVLVVPRDAVIEGSQGRMVYVVDGDRARGRNIALGADQGLMVVAASGLAPGDRVVVRGHRDLVEGALVRVTETATGRDGSMAGDPADAREGSSSPRGLDGGSAP